MVSHARRHTVAQADIKTHVENYAFTIAVAAESTNYDVVNNHTNVLLHPRNKIRRLLGVSESKADLQTSTRLSIGT